MRFLNRRPVVLFAALLVMACTNLLLAKKPDHAGGGGGGNGGGGQEPPPAVDFTYELHWLVPPQPELTIHPYDVNNHDIVVGDVWEWDQAFVCWDASVGMVALDDLIGNSEYTFEYAGHINDAGVIAGWAREYATSLYRPFRYHFGSEQPVEIFTTAVEFSTMGLNEAGDLAMIGQNPDEVIIQPAVGDPFSITVTGATSVRGFNLQGQLFVNYEGGCKRVSMTDPTDIVDLPGLQGSSMNETGSLLTRMINDGNFPDTVIRYRDVDGETPIVDDAGGFSINLSGEASGSYKNGRSPGWTPWLFTFDDNGNDLFVDVDQLLTNPDDHWNASLRKRTHMNDDGDMCGTTLERYTERVKGNKGWEYIRYAFDGLFLLKRVYASTP